MKKQLNYLIRINLNLEWKDYLIPSRHQIPAGSYEIASLIKIDLAKFIRESNDHEADILVRRFQNITL